MRTILLMVLICLGCSRERAGSQGTSLDPTIYDDVSRQPPGIFGEVEIVSEDPWRYDDPHGFNSMSGWRYRMRMGRARPPGPFEGDAELQTAPGQEREFFLIAQLQGAPTSDGVGGTFDDHPGHARLSVGRHVIVYAELQHVQPVQFWLKRAWRIDVVTDAVAEPCAGYQVGTPIALVLASRFPVDAGPSADAAVDATTE